MQPETCREGQTPGRSTPDPIPEPVNSTAAGLPSPLTLLLDLTDLDMTAFRVVTLAAFWPPSFAVFLTSAEADFFGWTLTVLSVLSLTTSPVNRHTQTHRLTHKHTQESKHSVNKTKKTFCIKVLLGLKNTVHVKVQSFRMVCACSLRVWEYEWSTKSRNVMKWAQSETQTLNMRHAPLAQIWLCVDWINHSMGHKQRFDLPAFVYQMELKSL